MAASVPLGSVGGQSVRRSSAFPSPRRGTLLVGAWVCAVVVVSLILRALVPIWIPADQVFDDHLFVRLASTLGQHRWLGPFDQLTLAKGPGFPMFIAVSYRFGIPLLIGEQIAHLAAAALAGWAVQRVAQARVLGVVAFSAVALDPSLLGAAASMVRRDNLYASICLALFSILVIAATFATPKLRSIRAQIGYVGGIGICAGVVLAGYWLTREEWPWLVPALLATPGVALTRGLRNILARRRAQPTEGSAGHAWMSWPGIPQTAALVLAALTGLGSIAWVSANNQRNYGASITSDFSSGQLPRVYGAWQSVEVGSPRAYVPIGRDQRYAVYAISPSAREMQPFLEGPLQAWIGPGCNALKVCDDIAAGFMPWALRDAVVLSGHYDSEPHAQAFLQQVGDEISAACGRGWLHCGTRMPAMLPTPSRFSASRFLESGWHATTRIFGFDLAIEDRPLSDGSASNWVTFASVIRGLPRSVSEQQSLERAALPRAQGLWPLRTVYALGVTIGFLLAVAGYVLCLWRRSAQLWPAWWVGIVAGVAVGCRMALLALIDSTSFPALDQYELPATGFLLLFVVIGVWLLRRRVADLLRGTPSSVGRGLEPGSASSAATHASSHPPRVRETSVRFQPPRAGLHGDGRLARSVQPVSSVGRGPPQLNLPQLGDTFTESGSVPNWRRLLRRRGRTRLPSRSVAHSLRWYPRPERERLVDGTVREAVAH